MLQTVTTPSHSPLSFTPLNGTELAFLCAGVPLRNYSLIYSLTLQHMRLGRSQKFVFGKVQKF